MILSSRPLTLHHKMGNLEKITFFFFLIRALTSFESVYLLDLITSKRLHFLIHGDGGGGDVRIIHTNFERTQTFSM